MTRIQISLAVVAAVYLLAWHGLYEIVPAQGPSDGYGIVFRLNRLTGAVYACGAQVECFPVGHSPVETKP